MARIRTIKPSIWADQRFCSLTRDERLLVIGLISQADDAGRFIAIPVTLSGNLFPLDNIPPAKIRKWRDKIASTGFIELYTVDGIEFGQFPNWLRHQRIDRPQPSSIPAKPPRNSSSRSSNHSANNSSNHSTTHSDTDRELDLEVGFSPVDNPLLGDARETLGEIDEEVPPPTPEELERIRDYLGRAS